MSDFETMWAAAAGQIRAALGATATYTSPGGGSVVSDLTVVLELAPFVRIADAETGPTMDERQTGTIAVGAEDVTPQQFGIFEIESVSYIVTHPPERDGTGANAEWSCSVARRDGATLNPLRVQ